MREISDRPAMPKEELVRICDGADMIIKGYAFKRKESNIEVFNVNDGFSMLVMTADGILIETLANQGQQNFLFLKMAIPR